MTPTLGPEASLEQVRDAAVDNRRPQDQATLESPDFLAGVELDELLSEEDDEDEDEVDAAGVLDDESVFVAAGVVDELLERESVR